MPYSCRNQLVLLKIHQYVICYNLMFTLSFMLAMKFHIIFVGHAVALKHATFLILTVSPVGISIAQNVRGVKMRIGILQVMKIVAATNFLLVRVGLACLRFNTTKCFAMVLIVQQVALSLLTFFMAMTVPMLMPILWPPIVPQMVSGVVLPYGNTFISFSKQVLFWKVFCAGSSVYACISNTVFLLSKARRKDAYLLLSSGNKIGIHASFFSVLQVQVFHFNMWQFPHRCNMSFTFLSDEVLTHVQRLILLLGRPARRSCSTRAREHLR